LKYKPNISVDYTHLTHWRLAGVHLYTHTHTHSTHTQIVVMSPSVGMKSSHVNYNIRHYQCYTPVAFTALAAGL